MSPEVTASCPGAAQPGADGGLGGSGLHSRLEGWNGGGAPRLMSTPASPARPNVTCALPEGPSPSDRRSSLPLEGVLLPGGRVAGGAGPGARGQCCLSAGTAVLGCPSAFAVRVSSDDLPSPPVPGGQGPLHPPAPWLPDGPRVTYRHRRDDYVKRVSCAGLRLLWAQPLRFCSRRASPSLGRASPWGLLSRRPGQGEAAPLPDVLSARLTGPSQGSGHRPRAGSWGRRTRRGPWPQGVPCSRGPHRGPCSPSAGSVGDSSPRGPVCTSTC